MLLKKLIYPVLLLLVCGKVFSQNKSLQAVKVSHPPVIDGVLDDAAWENVPLATDFIQNFPNHGTAASHRTEVKVIYDNSAIYIGAYLHGDPALIRRQITARDEEQQKDLDYFSVFFDTYDDDQNGFQFLVTTSNVQTDARLIPNLRLTAGEYGDKTWDAVWDSKVSITANGWIAEMRIPYLSLRFARKDTQNWGLQLLRSERRNNETTFWNPVDPNVNGFVNQFGTLKNLENVIPPLRLNFSPYISTGIRSTPQNGEYKTDWLISGGVDVKYGINESFTLDATIIPDFGQVVSDNVVNNLTPYEIRFQENRPFFTEGTEIFNKAGLFYSRRIGDFPRGYSNIVGLGAVDPNIEILKNPARTRLYNGLKLSGRTKKKLGIGVFNVITSPMYATIRDKTTGDKVKIQTDTLSNYNILVLDQALKGRSYITLTNTNVLRSESARDANVTGIDLSLYDKTNNYNFKASGHYTKVFQANSYDGFNSLLGAGRVSGKFQYYFQNVIFSPNYDPNDLGYISAANQTQYIGSISYSQFTPGRNFLNYNLVLRSIYRRLYRPDEFLDLTLEGTGTWTFNNFWQTALNLTYIPDQHDYFLLAYPQGYFIPHAEYSKYARRPAYGFVNITGNTDVRKQFLFNYNFLLSHFFNTPGKKYHVIEAGMRYRFSNKFSMELSHRHEGETDYIVYAGKEPMTSEPIIAFVDFKDVTSILSGIYNFTPRINLTLRARHYWSNVIYNSFANVDERGNPVPRAFIPGRDDNINIFNLDAFFTWDFRLGSRLIAGYKNALGDYDLVTGILKQNYISNLAETFSLRHANELTLRFIYNLNYDQLRKKR
ncbi:MAG: DUF5916 domain-containing protein [Chitinophagales bacterium]